MLTAGTARSVITPPVGVELSGYAGRPGPSTGIHDNIYAKALVIDDGSTRVGILTLDILALSIPQARKVRELAAEKSGIRPENILAACSHTHSAPAVQRLRCCGTPDEGYVEWMMHTAADTLGEAVKKTEPVSLLSATGHSGLGFNRSTMIDGKINPDGPVDHSLGVLILKSSDGIKAILYNYACHNVVLGQNNTLLSGDWAGNVSQKIEDATGADAFFLQGCCGDINPIIRGGFEEVEEVGAMVASEALKSLLTAKPADGAISVRIKTLKLPVNPPPSIEDLEKIASEAAKMRDQEIAGENKRGTVDTHEAKRLWAVEMIEMLRKGGCPNVLEAEVQAIRLGGVRLVTLPGEPFVCLGTSIKSGRENIFVVGYANGVTGYLPTAEAFTRGGYETRDSFHYYDTGVIVGPEAEDMLVSTARELIGKVLGDGC